MIRSGNITIDVLRRELIVDGVLQHLEPQAFDLLVMLASHPERVISKEELLDAVWGDQFVSEAALTTRVKEVRRAVGDDGTAQRVIRNLRGRGYRFVADIEPARPAASTTLVGRDDTIEEIEQHLEPGAIVTLTGPGGVGKTSIALDIARRWRNRRPDGVRVVRLSAVREPDDVIHALGIETGIAGTGDAFDTGIAALDALVVIDNAEHLVGAVARAVQRISDAGGNVRMLVTSRERLGCAGEQVLPIAPLDDASAVRLFLERARREDPSIELPSDAQLGPILDQLDRLPLGIEMAAPHLALLGPDLLAETLRERGALLQGTDHSAEERHQSLAAVVEWSVRLLPDSAADTLSQMSVFASAVSLTDIAAVLERDASELALTDLRTLTASNLVVIDTLRQPTTYRLLHMVRVAMAPLRPATVDRQHAQFIADAARAADDDIRRGDEISGARRFDSLLADVREAHRWARHHDVPLAADLTASLYAYAQERQWSEPALWCRELGDAVVEQHPAFAAVVAAEAANRGDYARSRALGALAAETDDYRVRAAGIDALSNTGMYSGELDVTRAMGRRLQTLAERHADDYVGTVGALAIVLADIYDGELARAEAMLDQFRRASSERPTATAWIRYTEGELANATGATATAVAAYEASIEVAKSVGNRFVHGVAEVSRLSALATGTDVAAAADAFVPVLQRYGQLRNGTHGVTALRHAVALLVRAGAHQPAMELIGALENPDVKATYGAESAHLAAVVDTARAIAGDERVDEWLRSGAGNDAAWATERAIDALSALATR